MNKLRRIRTAAERLAEQLAKRPHRGLTQPSLSTSLSLLANQNCRTTALEGPGLPQPTAQSSAEPRPHAQVILLEDFADRRKQPVDRRRPAEIIDFQSARVGLAIRGHWRLRPEDCVEEDPFPL